MQLGLETILRDGAGTLQYWAGFSFTYPARVLPYIHGFIITPRWVDEMISKKRLALKRGQAKMFELPIMLDNGAFAAWRDQIPLTLPEQLRNMETAAASLVDAGFIIEWAVVPDIVAGGQRSLERTEESISAVAKMASPLVPIQEGVSAHSVTMLAAEHDGGVFIGGGTMKYKREAVVEVRNESPTVHIHVARVHTDGQLHFHSSLAQTIDNTTFVQGLRWNESRPFELVADRYLERRPQPGCAKSTL